MKRVVTFGGKPVTLLIDDSWDTIDVESLVRIDYGNIVGELLTVDVFLNRMGMLRAEAENIVSELQLDLDTFSARFSSSYRRDKTRKEFNSVRKEVLKVPSAPEVSDELKKDADYVAKREGLMAAQHNLSIVDNIYWALKGKSDKLKLFEKSVNVDELDVLETAINGIIVRAQGSKIHN